MGDTTHRATRGCPRVAIIIPTLQLAGAEVMVANLSRALRSRQAPVSVFSLYDLRTPLSDEMEHEGVEITYLGKKRGYDRDLIARLSSEIARQQVEVLHSHLPILKYTVPAASRSQHKVRLVHTFHSLAPNECGSRLVRAQNRRFLHTGAVTPVALSEEIRDSVAHTYRIDPSRIPVVFNGIDLGRFSCETRSPHPGLRLLHVGRFNQVKNHHFLLNVYLELRKHFEDLSLCLVGDGPLRAEITERVAREEIPSVTFAGAQLNIAAYYKAADVFILPSRYEGLPMSIIEAMAAGLPVVASNVGGIPSLVRDGENGYVSDLDVGNFASRIAFLLEDPQRRRDFGQSSRILSTKFSSEAMAASYEALYSA